jgi:hypothetical protein
VGGLVQVSGTQPALSAWETLSSTTMTRAGSPASIRVSRNDGVWKLRRGAPGFWQRCTGVFTGDGRTIKGAWEGSGEGSQLKHDLDLNYVRPGNWSAARAESGGDPAAAKG